MAGMLLSTSMASHEYMMVTLLILYIFGQIGKMVTC